MGRRSGSGLTRCGAAGPSGSGLDRVTLRGDKKRCLSIHIPRGDAASARYLAREIFEYETYAAQGLEVTKGDTVVDVGANIGLFSQGSSPSSRSRTRIRHSSRTAGGGTSLLDAWR